MEIILGSSLVWWISHEDGNARCVDCSKCIFVGDIITHIHGKQRLDGLGDQEPQDSALVEPDWSHFDHVLPVEHFDR